MNNEWSNKDQYLIPAGSTTPVKNPTIYPQSFHLRRQGFGAAQWGDDGSTTSQKERFLTGTLTGQDRLEIRTHMQRVGMMVAAAYALLTVAMTAGAITVAAATMATINIFVFIILVVIAALVLIFGGKPKDVVAILATAFAAYGATFLGALGGGSLVSTGESFKELSDTASNIKDIGDDLEDAVQPVTDINEGLPTAETDSGSTRTVGETLKEVQDDIDKGLDLSNIELSDEDVALLMQNWTCSKDPVEIIIGAVKKKSLCKSRVKGVDYYIADDGVVYDSRKIKVKGKGNWWLVAGGSALLLAASLGD